MNGDTSPVADLVLIEPVLAHQMHGSRTAVALPLRRQARRETKARLHGIAHRPPFVAHHSDERKRHGVVALQRLAGGDSGLAAALSGATAWEDLERDGRASAVFETWVFGELKRRAAAGDAGVMLSFWRTHTGREVDFVVARGERAIGIEAKSGRRIDRSDFAGLDALAETKPLQFGVVLYGGTSIVPFGANRLAVPASAFFL